jgi:hypothetical protein
MKIAGNDLIIRRYQSSDAESIDEPGERMRKNEEKEVGDCLCLRKNTDVRSFH